MTGTTHSIAELVIRLGARPSGKPPTLSAAFLPSIILMTRPLKIVLTLTRDRGGTTSIAMRPGSD
jgi:hypothetical protein